MEDIGNTSVAQGAELCEAPEGFLPVKTGKVPETVEELDAKVNRIIARFNERMATIGHVLNGADDVFDVIENMRSDYAEMKTFRSRLEREFIEVRKELRETRSALARLKGLL